MTDGSPGDAADQLRKAEAEARKWERAFRDAEKDHERNSKRWQEAEARVRELEAEHAYWHTTCQRAKLREARP